MSGKEKGGMLRRAALFVVVCLAVFVSNGLTFPNPPGSGKDIAESKGVHREMESEGSWMENSNPLEEKEEN